MRTYRIRYTPNGTSFFEENISAHSEEEAKEIFYKTHGTSTKIIWIKLN